MSFTEEDRHYLRLAIDESERDPREFKVGAVIVKGGQIVAKAHGGEPHAPRQHAELTAVKKCEGVNLADATIYATLEPCVADVRKPERQPCSVEIINQSFRRVVIGVLDPNPDVRGRGRERLQSSTLEVVLCEDHGLTKRIQDLNKAFFYRSWPRFTDYPVFSLDRYFQGRVEERKLLSDWLSRRGPYGHVAALVLVGIGGVGKTNLTGLWAKHDVAGMELPGRSEEPDDVARRCRVEPGWAEPLRVFWFSFYRHEGGGDFAKFLEEAIVHFSAGTKSPYDYRSRGRIDYIRLADDLLRILKTERSLIVWDGAERLLIEYADASDPRPVEPTFGEGLRCNDIRVSQFLWNVAGQSASKLLIASRVPFADLQGKEGARELPPLNGLDPLAAVNYLRALGLTGPTERLELAAKFYAYHPLSLRNLVASLIGDDEDAAAFPDSLEFDPGSRADERRHHVLERAYQRRASHRRELLSRIATVRGAVRMSVVSYLAQGIEGSKANKLKKDLAELAKHGLIKADESTIDFDLHPLVRQYAYSRLKDPSAIHLSLAEYFRGSAEAVDPQSVKAPTELAPIVELLYHTIRAGQFDSAYELYYKKLNEPLYNRFGAYQLCIELLRRFFPEGEHEDPPLSDARAQLKVINDLASSYSCAGRSRRAVQLFSANSARMQRDSAALGIIAANQFALGDLRAAEENYAAQLGVFERVSDSAAAQATLIALGCLESYVGRHEESRQRFEQVVTWCAEHGATELECVANVYRALGALLREEAESAIEFASNALGLAKTERNLVRAQWALGSAHSLPGHRQDLNEAQNRLDDALSRCKRVNLVDFEADILVALARLHYERHAMEAATIAAEQALGIAVHCEYRLTQADAHLILAYIASEAGQVQKCITHSQLCRELAWCQGPSHSYAAVLKKAELLGREGR